MDITGSTPILLIAVVEGRSLAQLLEAQGYTVLEAPSGQQTVQWARSIHPDLVILDAQLPDMSGMVACRLLRSDPEVERNVPILILAAEKPTPEQRVTALSAGAWDFLVYPDGPELTLRIEAYVQAKRAADNAADGSPADSVTRIHSRTGLVRRARELGALMVRCRQGLGCIVFDVETDPPSARAGPLVSQAARVSDVVGALGPTQFAVVAPATDVPGMLDLAKRVAAVVRGGVGRANEPPAVLSLHAGFDAAPTLTYDPMDPAVLIGRAAAAVRHGQPQPGLPWLRRYDAGVVTTRTLSSVSQRSARP